MWRFIMKIIYSGHQNQQKTLYRFQFLFRLLHKYCPMLPSKLNEQSI